MKISRTYIVKMLTPTKGSIFTKRDLDSVGSSEFEQHWKYLVDEQLIVEWSPIYPGRSIGWELSDKGLDYLKTRKTKILESLSSYCPSPRMIGVLSAVLTAIGIITAL